MMEVSMVWLSDSPPERYMETKEGGENCLSL